MESKAVDSAMVNGNKVILGMVCFLVAGCGGTGSGTGITNSPFVGSYAGTWSNTTSGANGPANVSVTSEGDFVGTFHDNVSNTDEAVDAVIDDNGNVNGSIVLPGPVDLALTGPLTLSAPTLSGTLTESSGGSTVGTLTVSLTKS